MTQDFLEYPKLVEQAMRSVVRSALLMVADNGLPGLHHFYITFRTTDPGVQISDRLLAQYPEEMTIVLEHQFWDLLVDDTGFSVGLSFGGARENLSIPFAAISAFVDPSVKFGLQFDASNGSDAGLPNAAPEMPDAQSDSPAEQPDGQESDESSGDAEIVALDNFRKK